MDRREIADYRRNEYTNNPIYSILLIYFYKIQTYARTSGHLQRVALRYIMRYYHDEFDELPVNIKTHHDSLFLIQSRMHPWS